MHEDLSIVKNIRKHVNEWCIVNRFSGTCNFFVSHPLSVFCTITCVKHTSLGNEL